MRGVISLTMTLALALAGLASTSGVQAQQRAYRMNERQMRQLLRRIETRADRFSNSLRNALDRSRHGDTSREREVNRLVSDFEYATDQLQVRFNRGDSTAADVEGVLNRAAMLNAFMRNNQLARPAERQWRLLRRDLDQLARTYSVVWNWNYAPAPGGVSDGGYDAMLTGTYRLNAAQSDDPRRAAENATRRLGYNVRQRISGALVRRLKSPDTLAIERRGQTVTLASTRSPQVTIEADGREHVERYPNGRTTRVRASLSGDVLTFVSNGDRANDFTITIDPLDNGRRLLVTRSLYAERLDRPVTVRSYYDRLSDVAQLNLYNPSANTGADNKTGAADGSSALPDGTLLVAVLNRDLNTRDTREGERFTMTVRAPAQYEGAVIEGRVSDVDRSGRATGRSEMTLNYDSIRLRDGRTYQFAATTEAVRSTTGELVRVDKEGAARGDSRTNETIKRTAIGSAVGAILGAILDGGEGAAIGAAIGAGAGAGSVYVQGSEDLALNKGTEFTLRSSVPR